MAAQCSTQGTAGELCRCGDGGYLPNSALFVRQHKRHLDHVGEGRVLLLAEEAANHHLSSAHGARTQGGRGAQVLHPLLGSSATTPPGTNQGGSRCSCGFKKAGAHQLLVRADHHECPGQCHANWVGMGRIWDIWPADTQKRKIYRSTTACTNSGSGPSGSQYGTKLSKLSHDFRSKVVRPKPPNFRNESCESLTGA